MVGLLEGCFYEYFLVTGYVGHDFIWFLESHRTFYLSDRCLFTPFLHGEISLLSLHPWITQIHINIFKNSFNEIFGFLKKPKITLKEFCKQSTLKPTIFDWKWHPGFSFAGFFVVRFQSADASVFHNKNKLWFFEKKINKIFHQSLR